MANKRIRRKWAQRTPEQLERVRVAIARTVFDLESAREALEAVQQAIARLSGPERDRLQAKLDALMYATAAADPAVVQDVQDVQDMAETTAAFEVTTADGLEDAQAGERMDDGGVSAATTRRYMATLRKEPPGQEEPNVPQEKA